MGSGLLYGGIGVLWLVVLGQRWLHRRTLVRADRSAPASSRQRIIEPRSDRRTRSGTVVAMTAVPARGSARSAVGPAPDNAAGVAVFEPVAAAARRSRAVRRRRRVLLALLVLTAVAVVTAVLDRVPWWAPVVAAGATVCWFVSGASVARAGRRARRGHRRRARNRELARAVPGVPTTAPARTVRPPMTAEPSWDSVPAVEVVARWGRENSDTDGLDRRELAAAGLGRSSVEPTVRAPSATVVSPADGVTAHGPGAPTVLDPASWQPVPVPLPSYLTAPRVPRTVARIDFGLSGSWTSAVTASVLAAGGHLDAPGDAFRDGRGPVSLGQSAAEHGPQIRSEPRPGPAIAEPRVEVETSNGVADEQTTEVPYELPRAVGD